MRAGTDAAAHHPFPLYATDRPAFAHLAIAVALLGPCRYPVRSIRLVGSGMIACAASVPLAPIGGRVRDIPLRWTAIDVSAGVLAMIPPLTAHRSPECLDAPTAPIGMRMLPA